MTNKRAKKLALRPAVKAPSMEPSNQVVQRYDMELSKKRLEERGFHKAVTTKTREELLTIGGDMMVKYNSGNLPTRDCFLSGATGFQGRVVSQSRVLTRALLLCRQGLMGRRSDEETQDSETGNNLACLLDTVDVGGQISELIFAEGYQTVHKVALTSTQSWTSLANSSRLWDFFAADFIADGPARVFVAVAPEYTIGEFTHVQTYDPYGMGLDNPLSSWFREAIETETDVYFSICQLHRRLQKRRSRKPPLGYFTDVLVKRTKQLADVEHIHGSSQFNSAPPSQVFNPTAYFSLTRLRLMMKKIYQQRAAIRVLHFQKIPFLDRRIFAIVLRACPHVEMVGIYDCPLLHFGDVLCLLDLIHEVNGKRRKDGLPEIKALDFFPRYHKGLPYRDATAQTFGLTWGPQSQQIVQRGFYSIILKAFMKAKAMKLGLLFAKGKAFRDFLFSVPNYTLAVPCFLDALYRWSDLQSGKKGVSENERKQTIFDLLKPVRIGLEKTEHDWPQWYVNKMGNYLVFCSSCGYEMFVEFFTAGERGSRPHTRVCAGCLLQRRLDEEDDHLKEHKKRALACLFPDWKGFGSNLDAPLGAAAQGLISLKSADSQRPEPPPLTLNEYGDVYQPNYQIALVRDHKIHWDSLQKLPSLADLVENRAFTGCWTAAINNCHHMDMYSRLTWRLKEELNTGKGKDGYDTNRWDGGMPDHIEEHQALPRTDERASYSFNSVLHLETKLYHLGWL